MVLSYFTRELSEVRLFTEGLLRDNTEPLSEGSFAFASLDEDRRSMAAADFLVPAELLR